MSKKTILVVDDSDFDREILSKALSLRTNFDCITAKSGAQCLELLGTHKIDLVLLDIMMPQAFGTQILSEIRARFSGIELPVIMVTVKSETSDIVGCLKSGANDYLMKPINFDIAISRISSQLNLSEASLQISRVKEIQALDAMITTYHHEINTPLGTAIGYLDILESDPKNLNAINKIRTSLWRISEIIKNIRKITDKKDVEYCSYDKKNQMLKIK